MGDDVRLAPFNHNSRYFEDAVRVYMAVFGDNSYSGSLIFFDRYSHYPHFQGLVAVVKRQVVGMAFGTQSLSGQWWHDKVAEQVGVEHPALHNAWVLTELGVLAAYRNQGIGVRLHDAIIARQPLPNLLLSTQVANQGARRLYERLGWAYLHMGFAFNEGQEPYCVMYRRTV